MAVVDETRLLLRCGSFGARVVVLCVERIAANDLSPALHASGDYFGEEYRSLDTALELLPYDELRNVCHFDSRCREIRTARRPSVRANASSQMASLLYGAGEAGQLSGARMPKVGQHVICLLYTSPSPRDS